MGLHSEQHERQRKFGLVLLALATLLAVSPRPAAAAPGEFYSRQRAFLIPFQTDPGERRVKSVFLHVSEDSGRTYGKAGTAGPTDKYFRFTTDRDGWFWFAVQTQDTAGELHPANLELVQPSLKVCVDTRPPTIALRAVTPRDGNAAVEWELRDELSGIDLNSLRVEYQSSGGNWAALTVRPAELGSHQWNVTGTATVKVKLSVRDRAGNTASAETTLTPGASVTGTGTGTNTATQEPLRSNVIMVNKLSFSLKYEIDPSTVGDSKVKAVEIWQLKFGATDWEKVGEETPEKGLLPIQVKEEGRYGYRLIARSGADLSEPPPKRGDAPDVWVEVDVQPPVVQVKELVMGRGIDNGRLTIRWQASDKHMALEPISLSFCDRAEGGEWKPFATSVRNDGSHVWDIQTYRDKLPPRIWIRVEAKDQAGNVGYCISKESVPTDLKVPRAKIIEAATGP